MAEGGHHRKGGVATARRALLALAALAMLAGRPEAARADDAVVALPAPEAAGETSVEAALAARRSVRRFAERALTIGELGQLLWAAQGITDARGHRTAPSAGALYPLTVYAAVGRVSGLAAGIWRYRPGDHALARTGAGDRRAALAEAAYGQAWIAEAPAVLVIAGDESVTAAKYGPKAARFVAVEAGLAAENVALQAVARELGATVVGGFDTARAAAVVPLAAGETVMLLLPVGALPGG
jgi:SagB-type dehydrogenase family enzyme